ncbi:MAG: hypothetical protein LBR69_06965 [Endomicrobium sp.]|jgi:hypothetical protein|nr:hypothetical protein [Endomicrobium sp.]
MGKNKKIFLAAFGFMFFAAAVSFAAVKDDPIMIKGIRPMGMGGAFTAVADDENAFFYNPAGIAQRTGSLFQIFNLNASVNTNTVDLANDFGSVFKDLGNSADNNKINGLITVKERISDKDIDFMLSLFNPAYISGPISLGSKGNTLSIGAGIFDTVNVGVRAGMEVPRFMLEFARLASRQNFNDQVAFVSALADNMLNVLGILQPGKTATDVRDAIEAGASWSEIASQFLSSDTRNLIDNIQSIADTNADDGDKYAAIAQQLNNFKDGMWSIDGTNLRATVNAYASAALDVPVAYKIRSLEALRIPGELSIGANLKYIHRAKFSQTVVIRKSEIEQLLKGTDIEDVINTRAGASYGQGFGFDVGMMYSYNPRVHFGLQVSDIYTNIDYNKGFSLNKNRYPDKDFVHEAYIAPQFNIGASYIPGSIFGLNTKDRLILAADIRDVLGSYQSSFKNKLHMGAEYRLGCLALRAGLNKLRPSAGLGLEFSWFQLSYAYYGEESYLAKMLDNADKTVYYHEFLLAFKIGHLKGRKAEKSELPLRLELEKIPAAAAEPEPVKTETPAGTENIKPADAEAAALQEPAIKAVEETKPAAGTANTETVTKADTEQTAAAETKTADSDKPQTKAVEEAKPAAETAKAKAAASKKPAAKKAK